MACRTASWRLSSSTSKTRPETSGNGFNSFIVACSLGGEAQRSVVLILALQTALRPGDRLQAPRRDCLPAAQADSVGAVFDAPQRCFDQGQGLGVGFVAIQEEPFLLALLRHIAVVTGFVDTPPPTPPRCSACFSASRLAVAIPFA